MTRNPSNPWVAFPKRTLSPSLRLFCFPYAGGGAHIYYPWAEILPTWIEVAAIALPGRGSRIREAPMTNIQVMADALAQQLLPLLNIPFAFFGHSLGATIAFETIRVLRKRQGPQPAIFFPAGRRAPQLPDPDPPTYHLAETPFVEELKRLNGTPKEILANQELMQIVLPVIRADFEAAETYQYHTQPPLSMPFVVFGGRQDLDNHTDEAMQAWQMHTSGTFHSHGLPGDHFFIHSDETHLVALLQTELTKIVNPE